VKTYMEPCEKWQYVRPVAILQVFVGVHWVELSETTFPGR